MAHYLLNNLLEYADLEQLLGLSEDERKYFVQHNIDLYKGDHWLNGEGNIGITASPDDPQQAEIGLKLQRRHISSNKIKEITLRQRNAIFGVEPTFDFTVRRPLKKVDKMIPDPSFIKPPPDPNDPTPAPAPDPAPAGDNTPVDPKAPAPDKKPQKDAAPLIPDPTGLKVNEPLLPDEEALVNEAREAYLAFWDDQKPLKAFKQALTNRLLTGRGAIRIFVPARFVSLDANGKPRARKAKDLKEAMKMIYIEAVAPDVSRVAEDVFTRDLLGITKLQRQTKSEGTLDYLEISFVDDLDRTFIGLYDKAASAANKSGAAALAAIPAPAAPADRAPAALPPASNQESATAKTDAPAAASPLPSDIILSDPLELNGKLPIFEMKGEPLITPQMRRQQYLVNHAFTMAGFVMTEAGVSEMALTNVELETETVKDSAGRTKEVPKRLKRGGASVNNFIGVETVGKDGSAQLATPGIHFKEPSSVKTMQEGKDLGYSAMLEESCQQYADISGDANISGESRIQATSDFILFSGDFKTDADQLGVWAGETVLNYAACLCGRAGAYYEIRHTFESKLRVSLPTSDERNTSISEMNAKIKSRQRAQMDAGITDPDAENALIAEETRRDQALIPPQLQPFTGNGNPPDDPKNPVGGRGGNPANANQGAGKNGAFPPQRTAN